MAGFNDLTSMLDEKDFQIQFEDDEDDEYDDKLFNILRAPNFFEAF